MSAEEGCPTWSPSSEDLTLNCLFRLSGGLRGNISRVKELREEGLSFCNFSRCSIFSNDFSNRCSLSRLDNLSILPESSVVFSGGGGGGGGREGDLSSLSNTSDDPTIISIIGASGGLGVVDVITVNGVDGC